jgi:hypothetical protein
MDFGVVAGLCAAGDCEALAALLLRSVGQQPAGDVLYPLIRQAATADEAFDLLAKCCNAAKLPPVMASVLPATMPFVLSSNFAVHAACRWLALCDQTCTASMHLHVWLEHVAHTVGARAVGRARFSSPCAPLRQLARIDCFLDSHSMQCTHPVRRDLGRIIDRLETPSLRQPRAAFAPRASPLGRASAWNVCSLDWV